MGFYAPIVFSHASEFDKNANSLGVSVHTCSYIELVWRLSEFAFFVRLLR